jgi:CAAX protease family protein
LAGAVILFVHWANWPMPTIQFWELVLLGALLGPALEESFFRGFLLPAVSRTTGVPLAVLVCALLFTALHKPPNAAQWASFTITGLAYGWMRVNSGSAAAAIMMHAVYNLTLFLYQVTGT